MDDLNCSNNNHLISVRVHRTGTCNSALDSASVVTPDPDTEDEWEQPTSECDADIEPSTSAVLHYCKRKIIIPYQKFLTLLGWRPFVCNEESRLLPLCLRLASKAYVVLMVSVMLTGYVLQYAACFRRDIVEGHQEKHDGPATCEGSAIGLYFVPDILHVAAYMHTFYLFRICDNEQLQTLMERVFLQAFNSRSGYVMQHKLIGTLRAYWVLGLCWLGLSSVGTAMRVFTQYPTFAWIQPKEGMDGILVGALAFSLLWNDVTHAAIMMNYSIQCQLLISFLRGVADRIFEKSIGILEAIKDIHEAAKMVKYLNEQFAVSVALLILHSGTLALGGLVWVTVMRKEDERIVVVCTNAVCAVSWTLISLFPLIQASRLTAACGSVGRLGLLLQTRPFGYQECAQQQLDTFLLFTSSLQLKAKIFRVPVKPVALFATLTLISFLLLLLTQLDTVDFPK